MTTRHTPDPSAFCGLLQRVRNPACARIPTELPPAFSRSDPLLAQVALDNSLSLPLSLSCPICEKDSGLPYEFDKRVERDG